MKDWILKLDDFKVRILDSKAATAAPVRVTIESSDGLHKWDTVGVSENIIEASYGAIVDSIYYGLILQGTKGMQSVVVEQNTINKKDTARI